MHMKCEIITAVIVDTAVLGGVTPHVLTSQMYIYDTSLHQILRTLIKLLINYYHQTKSPINPLKPELNPICYLLALLGHHFLHVSRIRVKLLTFRPLMSYVYEAPILDVSRSHTTTQHRR